MALLLTELRICGTQVPPAAVQQEDMNVTGVEVRVHVLEDDVSRLTDLIMEINNVSRGPPGENWLAECLKLIITKVNTK